MSLKAVGDWSDRIAVPLSNALNASIEILGKSGYKACEMALVYMANSAGSPGNRLTKISIKKRKTGKDRYGRFIKVRENTAQEKKLYKWALREGTTFEKAREPAKRGLAQRSWIWGLKGFKGAKPKGREIRDVGNVTQILSETACGLVLTNKLPYISKVISPILQDVVSKKASDSIMAQAAMRIEQRFKVEIPRLAASRAKVASRKLAAEFKKQSKGAA